MQLGAGMSKDTFKPRLIGEGKSQRFALAADIGALERRSIFDQFNVCFASVRSLGRQFGIEESDIEEIIRHEYYRREERSIRDAYQAGRRSALPVRYGVAVTEMRLAA